MARRGLPALHCLLALLILASSCVVDAAFHSIWPKSFKEIQETKDILDELRKDLDNDGTKLRVCNNLALGSTWYWYADLTPELVNKYKNFEGVRHVAVPNNNDPSILRAVARQADNAEAADTTLDPDAPDQLKVLSLPAGRTLANSRGYKYDSTAGEKINVYVIDSGLTPSSPEFESRDVSWIFAGPLADDEKSDADVGEEGAEPRSQGHGTCMASIAMGNKDGVARKASLTVVKCDVFSTEDNQNAAVEIYIDALSKVYDTVVNEKQKSKAVVSMSLGINNRNADMEYETAFADAMATLLQALEDQDVPVTAAVGNDGAEIESYPALFVKPIFSEQAPRVPDLVAVGSFLIDSGDFENDIKDTEIKIYGPGDDQSGGSIANPGLECASRDGEGYHKKNRGTSPATAAIAGLLATFMSQGDTGAEARERMYQLAVQRINNGPPTAFNGLDGTV